MNKRQIIISNIKKRFGKREILKGIDANLDNTEVVGLLGPNGSGKTTLFYIIAGLLYPEEGSVMLDGFDIKEYPMYKRARLGIGYLPQDVSIFRGMTVEENIDTILQIYYKDKKERLTKLDEIIEDFSISHIRKSSALALSGGERRRVEIARTIASSPSFVLFDEPFAGVDPIAVSDLRDLIISLKKQNIGVLITDHNVIETLNIVDRAYILHDGKIIFQGNKEEIMSHEGVREVYLGDSY
ncbi:MAG: LPS export ABC transporter ATP-binding protein [Alphaproteobacteria bacterium]|jgi:lipopolysaccharide export system ATP-binding protein|nr:LPS export ABC transporter ATP-binding protein [Alphaproteobacteria bacterium]